MMKRYHCVSCIIGEHTGFTILEQEDGRKRMDIQSESFCANSEEEWMGVPGTDGLVLVSNLGRVKSAARAVMKKHSSGKQMVQHYPERVLDGTVTEGYRFIHYGIDGKKIRNPVHTLVLEAFRGPRPVGMEACHYDGDSLNNAISNLRWDTHHNNNMDRKRIGRYASGENHVMARFTQSQIARLRSGEISYKEIGMSYSHYWRIMTNKAWKR